MKFNQMSMRFAFMSILLTITLSLLIGCTTHISPEQDVNVADNELTTEEPAPPPVEEIADNEELDLEEDNLSEYTHRARPDDEIIDLIIQAFYRPGLNTPSTPRPLATGEINDDFYYDAMFFVNLVEETHPIFAVPELFIDDYERVREEFISYASRAGDTMEFFREVQRYVRVLRDGHMTFVGTALFGVSFLGGEFSFDGFDLFINHLGENLIVTEIGGVPIKDIIKEIETYFYFENHAFRNMIIRNIAGSRELLLKFGVTDEEVLVTTNTGDIIPLNFETREENTMPERVIQHKIMDDVFYIDLRVFIEQEPYHSEVVDAIWFAIREGTRNFIVDLRDNPGGNTAVGYDLLNAMGMSIPSVGIFRLVSPLLREQHQVRAAILLFADASNGDLVTQALPDTTIASNPNDVNLVVLTNNRSYSSANQFGTWVQDGNLGVIIGEPSSNSASSIGDMIRIEFPRTPMLRQHISTSIFIRPDIEADHSTLVPDIAVSSDYALEAALEFFKNLD